MHIQNEINEVKRSFSEGGLLTKLFLILGLFFGISSLTSITATIVEWKGFILNAVNTYQTYFVSPIVSVGQKFGFSYSTEEVHTAILLSICVTVGMRVLALGQVVAFREINRRYGSNASPSLTYFWVMSFAFPTGTWVWYGVSDPVIRPWFIALIFLGYPIFIIAPKLVMAKFGTEPYEKGQFSYMKSYYSYLLFLFLVVGILAAINTGIKDEPNNSSKRDINAQLL
ncbi:MAG: hypothetical protein ABW157_20030 [Candidatus Thiodiazotropha sp. LLP2]